MGLDIEFYLEEKHASLDYSYHTIHILREYACKMVGAISEDDEKPKENFPNLVWHSDCEGYYVGFLPSDNPNNPEWSKDSQLWVGSVEGLYKELQKISTHMIANNFEGEAKKILSDFLRCFAEIGYDSEENGRYVYIVFH